MLRRTPFGPQRHARRADANPEERGDRLVRVIAAWLVDLFLLAGGIPLAVGLARLGAGSSWPQVAALLFLGGAALYVIGLRLSPLKATLGRDLLGVRRNRPVAQVAPSGNSAPSPPSRRFCPACGQAGAPDARFCKACGRVLS